MNQKEIRFESDIETSLLTHGGWSKGPRTYNRELGLDLETLLSFLEDTQPNQMERYKTMYGENYKHQLVKRLNDEIKLSGMIAVFRKGIIDRGIRLKLAFFKPETKKNPVDRELYEKNIFHVVRQFKYSVKNENSIDMVLLVNGLPLVALELKNQFTGQNVDHAKRQFMNDRDPKELVFEFNKRFLVYFAVDHYECWMTTKLEGISTYFLPFNQGSNGAGNVGGKGNPIVKEGYTTSYLWEHVLTADSLMEILKKYIHLDKEVVENKKTGKKTTKERLIFPRYHQLDVVTKLLADVKTNGSGKNYLIQHSAGSGKSNSIAWLAHRLASLHDDNDESIFSSIIVVTDRRVLDSQLQDTIYQFDHVAGVVEKIDKDKKSAGLKKAIDEGRKIIITTIHKFAEIHDKLEDVTGRRFAIIVDEAHSSQNGRMAQNLRFGLADTEEALKEYAILDSDAEKKAEEAEDQLFMTLLKQGQHKNQTFFAFTATPKRKTLQMFGERQEDGTYRAFHIYSMKQAIEEGFILDVLKNYTTMKSYYKVIKSVDENPELPESKTKQMVGRWVSISTIAQKTAIMVEQFREVTQHKIGGRAKAMVVTQSRLHALLYCEEFKRYIKQQGYDLNVLVAFSGVVKHNGEEFKESDVNHIAESQLPSTFHEDEYSMLIVAEKYQTGFDEPLLHTMFVDKKLNDVKAVQTLSRLNRTCRGKEDTFVLDFVNEAEDIQKAFEPYFECTTLEGEIDVNAIYDAITTLRDTHLWGPTEIDVFMKIFNAKKQSSTDLGKLSSIFKPVLERFNNLEEEKQEEVKSLVKQFLRLYAYVTQIIRLYDETLHGEYLFLLNLDKFLPRKKGEKINIDDKIQLEYFKIKETFKGSITLTDTQTPLQASQGLLAGKKKEENYDLLEQIIEKVNEKYNGNFEPGDRVVLDDALDVLRHDKRLQNAAKRNDINIFKHTVFQNKFEDVVMQRYEERNEAYNKFLSNEEKFNAFSNIVAEILYNEFVTPKN